MAFDPWPPAGYRVESSCEESSPMMAAMQAT
jgi:hypothetical protein